LQESLLYILSVFDFERNFMMLHIIIQGLDIGMNFLEYRFSLGEDKGTVIGKISIAVVESFAFTRRLLQVACQHAQKRDWHLFRILLTISSS